MPIYEYHCKECNADFEQLVFGANPDVSCLHCGSHKTEKRLSQFGMGRSSGNSSSAPSSGSSGCGGCSSSSCAGCK